MTLPSASKRTSATETGIASESVTPTAIPKPLPGALLMSPHRAGWHRVGVHGHDIDLTVLNFIWPVNTVSSSFRYAWAIIGVSSRVHHDFSLTRDDAPVVRDARLDPTLSR